MWEQRIPDVYDILKEGSRVAEAKAAETLKDVKCCNEINYFDAFRGCDMRECNFKGANLYGAVLEHAKLDDIQSDEATQWFRMHCPETGPILGYKKCVNDRVVQLLIPADAKRTSAHFLPVQQGKGTFDKKF